MEGHTGESIGCGLQSAINRQRSIENPVKKEVYTISTAKLNVPVSLKHFVGFRLFLNPPPFGEGF